MKIEGSLNTEYGTDGRRRENRKIMKNIKGIAAVFFIIGAKVFKRCYPGTAPDAVFPDREKTSC